MGMFGIQPLRYIGHQRTAKTKTENRTLSWFVFSVDANECYNQCRVLFFEACEDFHSFHSYHQEANQSSTRARSFFLLLLLLEYSITMPTRRFRILLWLGWITADTTSFLVGPQPLQWQLQHRPRYQSRHALPNEYYYDYNSKGDPGYNETSDFLTALCLVPPIADWDRLQRARHHARDPLFHVMPPAIRLFHPFAGDPLDVAQVVEDLDIEPFEIVLDEWVVVPHLEAMQSAWENRQKHASVEDAFDPTQSEYDIEEDQKVQELIAEEERIGREKRGRKAQDTPFIYEAAERRFEPDERKSPAQILEEQKRQYEEFGGPCILCLEPDQESKEKLVELREALADCLNHDTYSSPSSVYSWKFVKEMDMGYRPLVPISSFESIQSALDTARRLKGLWGDPLRWAVTDFHVISCKDEGESEWETSAVPQSSSSSEWNKVTWGCNAKIMLMGAEIEQDEKDNEEMVNRLLDEGEPGGFDISNDITILDDEEEEPISEIEQWLDDDDFDEGTKVTIGRTEFLTGDQRTYKGMPASSVIDGKDKSLGEGGNVSGLARRRRTSSRQGSLWEDGEYGRRDNDYLPWNKRDKPKKLANLEALDDFKDYGGLGD